MTSSENESGASRRQFVRRVVAAGGATALAACLDGQGRDALDAPPGSDPETLPDRQHAWNQTLPTDSDGTVGRASHHVFLRLALTSAPNRTDRERVEAALRSVERALEWGPDGVLFTLGYTPAYFNRYEQSIDAVDLPDPDPITAITAESRIDVDDGDAMLHLASEDPAVVLAVEEALFGENDSLNGHDVGETLAPVFERTNRRTGFVGSGLPADRQTGLDGVPEGEPVPEEAPFFMGFRSGFRKSQATEDRVTIRSGPFAGGTTQHFESIELNLDIWFDDNDHEQRVARMFSPEHAAEEAVGTVGERLGAATGATDVTDDIHDHAREHGTVGHAQKLAQAREDGEPVLLRRDVNTTEGDAAGLQFLSLQRRMSEFTAAREAMLGERFHQYGLGPRQPNGILQYIRVRSWGSYLIPPRGSRALPRPSQ
nr:Tat pathway signal protein [Halorubrum sp. CSM-61]